MAASYTISGIREGIVSNLSTLGLQSTGYVLGSPIAPVVEVFPGQVAYDAAFQRGHDELTFTVRITVAVTLSEVAQRRLDEYLAPSGASSVKTLLESDRTLGGEVSTLQVTTASGYQLAISPEGGQMLSCDWTLAILA